MDSAERLFRESADRLLARRFRIGPSEYQIPSIERLEHVILDEHLGAFREQRLCRPITQLGLRFAN